MGRRPRAGPGTRPRRAFRLAQWGEKIRPHPAEGYRNGTPSMR